MAQEGSIAAQVRDYIDKRPVVQDGLRMGIVNLSALTRRIQDATGIKRSEAVLVACRRYETTTKSGYEEEIRRVLEGSKLEVRTRVAVWTLRGSWNIASTVSKALRDQHSPVHLLNGSDALTVIADQAIGPVLEAALDASDILRRRDGLVEVNLRTPSRIEDVQGVLAFVLGRLAGRGINFVEVISCHQDNMVVIAEEDLFAAFELLNGLIKP